MTAARTYEGFGQVVASSGAGANYGYAATSGYRDDGDAGLLHVGARYYDAQVGRFVTRDTDLSQKAYLYCEGDPVNYLDPTGHENKTVERLGNVWMAEAVICAGVGVLIPITAPVTEPVAAVVGILGAATYLIGVALPGK